MAVKAAATLEMDSVAPSVAMKVELVVIKAAVMAVVGAETESWARGAFAETAAQADSASHNLRSPNRRRSRHSCVPHHRHHSSRPMPG